MKLIKSLTEEELEKIYENEEPIKILKVETEIFELDLSNDPELLQICNNIDELMKDVIKKHG